SSAGQGVDNSVGVTFDGGDPFVESRNFGRCCNGRHEGPFLKNWRRSWNRQSAIKRVLSGDSREWRPHHGAIARKKANEFCAKRHGLLDLWPERPDVVIGASS